MASIPVRRSIGWATALLLGLAACTANRSSGVSGGSPSLGPASGVPSSIAASSGGTASGTPRPQAGPKGGTAGGSQPAAGPTQKTQTGFTYTAANLYPAAQDRIGITDRQITLCMHAALVAGPAFQESEEDFQVYWQWLNDTGGIYGRSVKMIFTDDKYNAGGGGVQAAQECLDNKPFFMMAGVGFDTVPAVRSWADDNKLLYLHSFATEKGLYESKYSFEFPPSVEQFGKVAGDYVGAKIGGKIGVLWRNSPNWQGGRDRFVASVKAKGGKIVADLPVTQNKGDYSAEIRALQGSGAQTVLAWINVLEFVQLEKQAAAQGYFPRWVTATFNLVTDTLGSDIDGSRGPAAIGLWVTPEYHNGTISEPWKDEVARMRAAYAKYDSGHTITDVDWQAWLAFKQVTQLLRDCGKDCTRNKVAGMMLSGYKAQLDPLCDVDFARGRGKLGSFAFNVMQVVNRGGTIGWKQVETCKDRF